MDINKVIDNYYRNIYRLCLFYLKDEAEAEEITQEVFYKAVKKQASFKGDAEIYTWLYRIGVNTCLNHINRKKIIDFFSFESSEQIKGKSSESDGRMEASDPAPILEAEEEKTRKLKQLEHCLEGLSKREKTAFYLFYYDGFKQKEISGIMQTSLSAVEALLHKGKKKLKRCIGSGLDETKTI